MDAFILILLIIAVFVFVLPLLALGQASGANSRVAGLQRTVDRLIAEMQNYRGVPLTIELLQQRLKELESRCADLEAGRPPSARPVRVDDGSELEVESSEIEPQALPAEVSKDLGVAGPEQPPVAPPGARMVAKVPEETPMAEVPAETQVAKIPEETPAVEKRREEGVPTPAARPAEESLEMHLGTYWFVRIGVVLLLTGAATLAYYKKQFFFDLSPLTKVSGLYLLSVLMGGVGFWLQRTRETLKTYGQVLFAGGCAGVYFTTYAAHIFPPVQVIPSPTVALSLLFLWGGFIVWIADRLKSETLAMFAIGAAYYATYVPLLHAGTVSHWVILASNLILAVAAVIFMQRNRWLKMPVLSMAAAYGGFLIWRLRVLDDPALVIVLLFGCSLWLVYTAAVFLSQDKAVDDRMRAAFLTANNGALFGLLAWELLPAYEDQFWVLPMTLGVALLGCSLGAARLLRDQPLSRVSYLTQGLVLVTLGLMTTQLSASIKGPVFAAESVVLLFMAIRRENQILQIGSFIAVGLAAGYCFRDVLLESSSYVTSGIFAGLFLLFNAWLSHTRLESGERAILRKRVSYFTGAAVAIWIVSITAWGGRLESLWAPAILVASTMLLTASVYRLRIREFVLIGQIPALLGIAWTTGLAYQTPEFSWPILCALVTGLLLAHWWRWQGQAFTSCCPEGADQRQLVLIGEAAFSAGFVSNLFAWISGGVGIGDEWLLLGPAMAVGLGVYGVVTRAWMVAALSQVFLWMACLALVGLDLAWSGGAALRELVPILTLWLVNLAVPHIASRVAGFPEGWGQAVRKVQTMYRYLASMLGLLWVDRFVPGDWHVFALAAVGVLFLLAACWRPSRDWYWLSALFLGVGAGFLLLEFGDGVAHWQSLMALLLLLGLQQLGRRVGGQLAPDVAHHAIISGAGIGLFLWLTVTVSNVAPSTEGQGVRSIAWAVLAVIYFSLGLGLKERWYRLMGLCTLGIALVSLFPIIWQMSTEMKIASFFVIGLIFVGLGFIYNHNKETIKKLL